MAKEETKFWVFDYEKFRQIEFPKVDMVEIFLIIGGLTALVLYYFLTRTLHFRSQKKQKDTARYAQMGRWLNHAKLTPHQLENLSALADGDSPPALYSLLGNPFTFEKAIHRVVAKTPEENEKVSVSDLSFVEPLRDVLGYHTDNLRVPVFSTRQLMPGDPMRLTLWEGGLPRHCYGKVLSNSLEKFEMQLDATSLKTVPMGEPVEVFYLRGDILEYGFACLPHTAGAGKLVLHHALNRNQARTARLLILMEMNVQILTSAEDFETASLIHPPPCPGLLLDLSTGGFAMATGKQTKAGDFLRFSLPLKRGRRKMLRLTGKVLETKPFSRGQWLSRCELKGLSRAEQGYLTQIVRLEQTNRTRVLATPGKKNKQKPSPPAKKPTT